MARINEKAMKRENRIKRIMNKVREMCKQAQEEQCIQPALEEELEIMLNDYMK